MRHLIYVNIVIICLDLVMLGFVYADLYELETTIKPGIYSVKPKLEFAVLNHLVRFSRASVNEASQPHDTVSRDRERPRRGSKYHEPPREHVFTGGRHPSHDGILRTTTIMVGSGGKKTQALTSPSQDPIVPVTSVSKGEGGIHHTTGSDKSSSPNLYNTV
jgi:hypothetical protein